MVIIQLHLSDLSFLSSSIDFLGLLYESADEKSSRRYHNPTQASKSWAPLCVDDWFWPNILCTPQIGLLT